MMPVDTRKVVGRRTVRYGSLDDLLAEAEQLAAAQVQMLGNWTLGQLLGHLAHNMNYSIDGFADQVPWPLRVPLKLMMQKRLLEGPMRPGFRLPARVEAKLVPPEQMTVAEGLSALQRAVQRQQSDSHRAPHPILGPLDVDRWTQIHLRHAELHMSFAIPRWS